MLVKHKHYNLILQWAEGSKIETLDSETGKWKQTEPLWFDSEEYRVYDPYRELREAAKIVSMWTEIEVEVDMEGNIV
jgi:hypothetical protein